MKINGPRFTLGKDPEGNMTESGKLKVTLSAAENISKNVGTKDEPKWEKVRTNWFFFDAYGETAEEILSTLAKGDSFELVDGTANVDSKDNKFFYNFTIWEFRKL